MIDSCVFQGAFGSSRKRVNRVGCQSGRRGSYRIHSPPRRIPADSSARTPQASPTVSTAIFTTPLEASALPLSIADCQRMSIVNYVQLFATIGITVATLMLRSCVEFITGKIYPFERRELSPCH